MDLKNILELHLKYLQGDKKGIRADLSRANLSDANLSRADLSYADLSYADLSDANLSRADLRGANLSRANLSDANLRGANLSRADLRDANLRDADLRGANLRGANLSGAENLLSSTAWMLSVFKTNKHGVIVYKAQNAQYESPKHWDWSPGKYLTEVPNLLPTVECGCGVNFATLEWIKKNHSESVIWECLIEWIDLCETVVPYNTDGKARCAKLKLVKQL